MPETSMHKYHLLETRQHNVGFARQVSLVQPKSEAHIMNKGPDQELRAGVRAFHAGHDATAFFRVEHIRGHRSESIHVRQVDYAHFSCAGPAASIGPCAFPAKGIGLGASRSIPH
jgi:hypothetical protein